VLPLGLGEQGYVLEDDARVLESVPTCRRAAQATDKVLEGHDAVVKSGDVRLRGEDLAEQAEPKVPDGAVLAVDRVLVVLRGDLVVRHKVGDDLVEVRVDALVDLEAKAELYLEEEVRVVAVDHILVGVRLVGHLHVEEVVRACAFGPLVHDRVEDVSVELVKRRVVGQEYEVVGKEGVRLVVGEVEELVEVFVYR